MDLTPPSVVELRGVSKRYASVQALRDISVAVEPGGVVAFLGPNGAGKSTSIAMMLGLRQPTQGQALLFGRPPRSPEARSRTGVMLQESGVPAMLKVRELIDLFRSYYPRPLDTAELLERSGLAEQAGKRIGSLSGGQKQRVYFALSLAGDPEVMFLDEPTTGLDVEARRHFWQQIRDFAARGRTIILTTHNLEEADALARRIVVIDHGRIIADGTPAAIKAHTAGKQVSFQLNRLPDRGFFDVLPLSGLSIVDHEVRFLSAQPEAALQALFTAGYELADLEVVPAGLEEAFLALTSGADEVAG
ncbi:MAG TPA: ABC transporter ATP-binding protein [Chloroflexota bacterium]|nr:ABC transporter ATP-binding protein [Chloroflexota bacterium]